MYGIAVYEYECVCNSEVFNVRPLVWNFPALEFFRRYYGKLWGARDQQPHSFRMALYVVSYV